jgi:hypothetical protein
LGFQFGQHFRIQRSTALRWGGGPEWHHAAYFWSRKGKGNIYKKLFECKNATNEVLGGMFGEMANT